MTKKRMSPITLIFVLALMICVALAGYIMIMHNVNQSRWDTRYIDGYVEEMILYNQFPDEELYVRFDDGNYTLIHTNPFWTYSHLSIIDFNHKVNITYQVNGYGLGRTINVRELNETKST